MLGKKCTAVAVVVFGLFLGLFNAPAGAQEEAATNRQVVYHNGFEAGEEGLSRWMNFSGYTINYAGFSEERAFKGKSSFKIDLTFTTGSNSYWKATRFYIPFKGSPRVSGALYVEKGNAAGIKIGYSENLGASGMCGGGGQKKQLPSGWSQWESNPKPTAYDEDHLEMFAVYIRSAPGERVVIFLDEFEVETTPQTALSEKIKEQILTEADIQKKKIKLEFQEKRDELRETIAETKRTFSRPCPPMPATAAPWLQKINKELKAYCENVHPLLPLQKKLERLAKKGETNPKAALLEINQTITNQLRYLRFGLDSYYNLPGFVKAYGDRPFLIYTIPPIRNDKVLPTSFPVPGTIGTDLSLSACPDEYRPVSFAIYAAEELKKVKVTASELSPSFASPNRKLSPQVDLFLVKCWWQAGVNVTHNDPDNPVFTPELLLKDPGLVVVDNIKKRNTLKNPDGPQDAKTLQPITIPKETLQQYWATMYIPKKTPAGIYNGSLKVEISGAPGITLPLSVEVLPFQLEPPVLEYGFFYTSFLFDDGYNNGYGKPNFDTKMKTEQQYLAEMMDLKAHGVELPACSDDMKENPDGTLDFSHMRKIWKLRKKAGLTKGPIVKSRTGVPIGEYSKAKDPVKKKELIKKIHERTKQWVAFCKKTGFPTLLMHGIDEASQDALAAQRNAYKAVQEAGGMTGVQLSFPFFRYAGDSLDRPIILHAAASTEELKKVHDLGYKAWAYSHPEGGEEAPETYRRNYGIALWQKGYDGGHPWGYQWNEGPSMWDDFDSRTRDFMMTYPALDGPISTIQWEGWREGVNDVRYLSTLLKLIGEAKTKEKTRSLALEEEQWLKELNLSGDLDLVRKEMVKRILQLRKILSEK